jgi:nitrogen regulatory protein P-II 1
MMKKIEAYIRPEKFDDVKTALSDIGIVGLSVANVQGRGRGAGVLVHGRTGDYIIDITPRTLITIVLSDHNVEPTVSAIKKAAYSGEKGDGVIFISPVEEVIRISSGERGSEALQYQGDIDSKKPVATNGKK